MCVSVYVCVCLSVKSHLTSGASVCPENSVIYSAGNRGQKMWGVFSKTAPVTSYESTAATFSVFFRQHSLVRVLKRLNNRLNTTWNTTRCKTASFFLFSLRLSPKVFRILSITRN